jgi:membrane protein DedA with SNARE-associated domain
MLEQIIDFLAGIIIAVIDATGYAGIALLMAIESACIPLPSEVIMPFSGYLVSTGRFDLFWVATAGALGCNIGSAVAYWVGYVGGRPAVERWGRYVLLDVAELDLVERYFQRYGALTVFVCRLLPVVRTFIALPAGIARMNQTKFHIYTFLGSWPWCWALAYIGVKLGEAWNSDPRLKTILHEFDAVIVLVLLLGAGWWIWRHVKRRRRS